MSSTPSGPAPTTRLRASDAEREEIAQIVREAVGEGRLDMAEGDQRLATVYAARYRDELNPIVNDLPDGRARRPLADGPRSADRDFGRGRPVGPPRTVAVHVGLVALLVGGIVAVWAVSGSRGFWPVFPLVLL